jgi:thymidylate synthase (FAD)
MHNLLHFLNLRLDSHAQLEIRKYAEAIDSIISEGWPITYQAFKDYVQNATTFSEPEMIALNKMLNSITLDSWDASSHLSPREQKEFVNKIDKVLSKSIVLENND